MRWRLVELLQCVRCQGELEATATEWQTVSSTSSQVFSCQRWCALERTTVIPPKTRCVECGRTDIVAGKLTCRCCKQEFPIIKSVPWLFGGLPDLPGDALESTIRVYGHIWKTLTFRDGVGPMHLQAMEEALQEPVTQGAIGLDAGSGCGADTATMAHRRPLVEVISLDM